MQLTDWRAKPAVPFGGKFRIIDFPLSNCVNSGIRRIGVATQYKSHSLIRHIQRGWSFLDGRLKEFVDLLPASQRVQEEHWYQGTADAVYQNLDILKTNDPEYILILAGDHIYKMDYGRMLAYHVSKQADMTVACIEVPRRGSARLRRDGRGRGLARAQLPGEAGQPAVDPRAARTCARQHGHLRVQRHDSCTSSSRATPTSPSSSHDFGKDIIPHLVPRYRVFAHRFDDSCVGHERQPRRTGATWARSMPTGKRTWI